MASPYRYVHYRFPKRQGNRFELLVDGANFLPRMLQRIRQAEHQVLLEQYLVESGRVMDQFTVALVAAVKRGVRVSILLDDYGSWALTEVDRAYLVGQGIDLRFYNPVAIHLGLKGFFRDHRKLMVVDNRFAYVGGAGLTDDFASDERSASSLPWHDVMLEIQGPVVTDWVTLFSETFLQVPSSLATPVSHELPDWALEAGPDTAQVVTASGLGRQEISRAFLSKIKTAKQRIWVTTPYFLATWKLRRGLRRAASRGIDVRLLLPGPLSDHPWISHASRRFYGRLLSAGVRIFEYQPRFTHSKIQLVDDWVSLGSSNLDRWNQRWNLDANQIVVSETLAQSVSQFFQADFAWSTEVTPLQWRARSYWKRWNESISHSVVSLLEWIFRNKPKD